MEDILNTGQPLTSCYTVEPTKRIFTRLPRKMKKRFKKEYEKRFGCKLTLKMIVRHPPITVVYEE